MASQLSSVDREYKYVMTIKSSLQKYFYNKEYVTNEGVRFRVTEGPNDIRRLHSEGWHTVTMHFNVVVDTKSVNEALKRMGWSSFEVEPYLRDEIKSSLSLFGVKNDTYVYITPLFS